MNLKPAYVWNNSTHIVTDFHTFPTSLFKPNPGTRLIISILGKSNGPGTAFALHWV